MSYTTFYTLPLVPCGVFFGALILLLVVPVFALAALAALLLITLGILIAAAGAILASPLLIARLVSRTWPFRDWPARLACWPMRVIRPRESLTSYRVSTHSEASRRKALR